MKTVCLTAHIHAVVHTTTSPVCPAVLKFFGKLVKPETMTWILEGAGRHIVVEHLRCAFKAQRLCIRTKAVDAVGLRGSLDAYEENCRKYLQGLVRMFPCLQPLFTVNVIVTVMVVALCEVWLVIVISLQEAQGESAAKLKRNKLFQESNYTTVLHLYYNMCQKKLRGVVPHPAVCVV